MNLSNFVVQIFVDTDPDIQLARRSMFNLLVEKENGIGW
jgi:hypothetical protein